MARLIAFEFTNEAVTKKIEIADRIEDLVFDEFIFVTQAVFIQNLEFIDNNGDGSCDVCKGSRNPESSDNPAKAIISLQNDRGTSYETYIKVQNELVAAYNDLRDELA